SPALSPIKVASAVPADISATQPEQEPDRVEVPVGDNGRYLKRTRLPFSTPPRASPARKRYPPVRFSRFAQTGLFGRPQIPRLAPSSVAWHLRFPPRRSAFHRLPRKTKSSFCPPRSGQSPD